VKRFIKLILELKPLYEILVLFISFSVLFFSSKVKFGKSNGEFLPRLGVAGGLFTGRTRSCHRFPWFYHSHVRPGQRACWEKQQIYENHRWGHWDLIIEECVCVRVCVCVCVCVHVRVYVCMCVSWMHHTDWIKLQTSSCLLFPDDWSRADGQTGSRMDSQCRVLWTRNLSPDRRRRRARAHAIR